MGKNIPSGKVIIRGEYSQWEGTYKMGILPGIFLFLWLGKIPKNWEFMTILKFHNIFYTIKLITRIVVEA